MGMVKNTTGETVEREPDKYTLLDVGCYVDSARGVYTVDGIVAFAESHGFELIDDDPQNPLPESLSEYEFANEIEDEADSYMNDNYGVDGAYWGRSEQGDWGLWMTEEAQAQQDLDEALRAYQDREYDGLVVSDLSEVPDNYTGEVLHINDHGNVTLYTTRNETGKLVEIASRV